MSQRDTRKLLNVMFAWLRQKKLHRDWSAQAMVYSV